MGTRIHLQGFISIFARGVHSLPLSLNVLLTDYFSFLRTVGSHVPCTYFFSFEDTWIKKGIQSRGKGSAGVWFEAHRGICGCRDRNHSYISGNIFTADTFMSVFVTQLLLAVSLVLLQLMQKPQSLHRQQAAACHLFSADSSYQTKVWVYQEERVCHVACTDTISSDERSRCCLTCGFVTCKLSWLTDISLMYMLGNDERTDSK